LIEKRLTETEYLLERTKCENIRLGSEIKTVQESVKVFKENATRVITDFENNCELYKIE
jgi:hypothetical protein